MAPELPAGHSAIESVTIAAKPLGLGGPCFKHLLAHYRAACAVVLGSQFLIGDCRYLNVQIDAVHQWPTDATHIALDLNGRALAWPFCITQESARTWIER